MKLQKQTSRKVGAKEYNKFIVTVPSCVVEKAGWREGETLHFKVNGDCVVISPSAIPDSFDSCEQRDGKPT